MKYALMLGGIGLGLLLGFLPSLRAPKPRWWIVLTLLSVTVTVIAAIFPPIGGTLTDVVMASRADSTKVVPFYCIVVDDSTLRDARIANLDVALEGGGVRELAGRHIIVNVTRGQNDRIVRSNGRSAVSSIDPVITLPYIMGLEERARIIFFHVPMSWVALCAYMISMIFGIRYLRSRNLDLDAMSAAAASLGTLYCVLATVTGAVWAKFNWGSFWNWDPRESSILVLLLIYAAYFLLRNSIADPERRARLSSVYSIVAFVTVPFLMFVLPRLLPGLHPGSADDSNAGPLLSPKSDAINPTKQVLFALSLFAFTLVYFWLTNLRYRMSIAERTIKENQA
ncbi:hypothetical protein BH10BAC6_BH10BAC6_07280 [soil metagenome]